MLFKIILRFAFPSLLLIVFQAGSVRGQQPEPGFNFDSLYFKGIGLLGSDLGASQRYLKRLESVKEKLTPVQQAKTNYLRLKVINSDPLAKSELEQRMFAPPDSLKRLEGMLFSAERYLEKSMPDKAIQLLMTILDTAAGNQDMADLCRITLCEAYRQKQEYHKGIEMLNEILCCRVGLSESNRAYACNRLAAIYDEWGYKDFNTTDSVEKYSYECIRISLKINSKPNLALAQNELGYRLSVEKKYDEARRMLLESIKNFGEAGMKYCEMSALINLSNVYIRQKEYDKALQAVVEASGLCNIEENRNLFMRLYFQFSNIYVLKENYKDAYEFLSISRMLLEEFFRDRISNQINEQSARFDLFTKEQKIREEKQNNQYNKSRLTLLLIVLIFLCILFIISFLYFRIRRKEVLRKKTIEAIIQTEEKERRRIASDLHDGIGPLLSTAKLYFQAYRDADNPEVRAGIETKMKLVLDRAIADMSRISHNISPQALENYGLIAALEDFIGEINSTGNLKINTYFERTGRFDLSAELTMYRTISELINNTIRHAKADTISIWISTADNQLLLTYEDDGIGLLFSDKGNFKQGMGLKNIETRIHSLGGTLAIFNKAGKGMKAQIKIPYKTIEIG